jgi:hypothetical protein
LQHPARSSNRCVCLRIYYKSGDYNDNLEVFRIMPEKISDRRRRIARLNRYVLIVGLLWIVTSFALLFMSQSPSANAAQPVPSAEPVVLHAWVTPPPMASLLNPLC